MSKLNLERFERLKAILESGKYVVDPDNGIISNRFGRRLYGSWVQNYLEVKLYHSDRKKPYGYYIHEVIAFVGGLDILDKTVNHIDGDKSNNMLYNLEAITHAENMEHYHKFLANDQYIQSHLRIETRLVIDGQELNDREAKSVLAFVRALRS